MSGRGLMSLRHGVEMLGLVAQLATDSRGVSAAELARHMGLHRSTTARLGAALVEARLLRRAGSGMRFLLGEHALELARAYLAGLDLPSVARPHLARLAERFAAPAVLAVPAGARLVVAETGATAATVSWELHVGLELPAHATGVGKAVLSLAPDAWIDRAIVTGLQALTVHTITDPSELRAELARTRARGFALEDREYDPRLRCVAVPVLGQGDAVIGAIAVVDVAERIAPASVRSLAAQVSEEAEALSRAMGATRGALGPVAGPSPRGSGLRQEPAGRSAGRPARASAARQDGPARLTSKPDRAALRGRPGRAASTPIEGATSI